jgi:protoporphyrinogen oxidase
MYTILGAGLSGLSIADHLSESRVDFEIYEGKPYGGGHIHSRKVNGFVWDEGPHVSFTKYEYVKQYFAKNCGNQFLEYPTKPTNYFQGSWITHPAQSNMYAVPNPLRDECVNDVIKIRESQPGYFAPGNYQEWIDYAFGKTFADNFPKVYTKKYWTTDPENLTTDWIGKRIYFPEIKDMVESAQGPLTKQTHYISKVRYPQRGGFYSFIKDIEKSLFINYNKSLRYLSFEKKELFFTDGSVVKYDKLISTLPLPQIILNSDAPEVVKYNAQKLKCSQVLLVNVVVDHPPAVDNHWIYVYDEDFYSTRINFTNLLAPENGINGKSGIQVEIYFSDYHKIDKPIAEIESAVIKELIIMGLIANEQKVESYHSVWLDWANVIFDQQRLNAQRAVFDWLEKKGMVHEANQLEPMTDWDNQTLQPLGDIILAGRFAQWKYFWTDDCVMRAKFISDCIKADKR